MGAWHKVAAAAACVAGLWAGMAEAADKNVLLYVVDDMGTNDAGYLGNPVVRTPGLDALAANGIAMTQAYAVAPSCSPSRSALLTGRYGHSTGAYGLQHNTHHFEAFDNQTSFPNLLNEAGYRTLAAGKFHVGPDHVFQFDEKVGAPSPVELAEKCRPLLEAESDEPFFLYFNTVEPHRPFKREGSAPISPDDVIVPAFLPDIAAVREELAQYYMSIERADSGLVKLQEMLKETGHWDDTLIIYLSDNGMPFPGAKTNVYDPGVHLPCVVRDPRLKQQGGTNDAMINYLDIAPTILEYAGVDGSKANLQGRSFLGVLDQEHPQGWDRVFMSHTFHEVTMYYPMRVVRDRQFKLIWNIAYQLPFPFAQDLWDGATWQAVLQSDMDTFGVRSIDAYEQRPEFELYDVVNDPNEVNNLIDDRRYIEEGAHYQAVLRAWMKTTNDPWAIKWRHE